MEKNKDVITIAIPIYNEVRGVESLVEKTISLHIPKEIILIDDGSTFPETIRIVEKLQKKYRKIRFIRNKKNIGKAGSVEKAIQLAKGNIFVILDGDSELDPHDIPVLYRKLVGEKADFVNGARVFKLQAKSKTYSAVMTRLARRLFSILMKIIYGTSVDDVLSGFKMFYLSDFLNYRFSTRRFGLETELLIHAIKKNKKMIETSVHYYPRTYKEGKKINVFDGIEIVLLLISQSPWYRSVLTVCLALSLMGMSFFAYTYSMRLFNTTDSLPNNFTALNILFNHRIDLTNLKSYLIKHDLIGITSAPNSSGHIFSKTPPLLGLLSTPFFFLFNTYYGVHELSGDQFFSNYNQYIGKLTAALWASLSVILVFFILLKLVKRTKIAFVSTLVYAFGTNIFNTASQANWQHAVSLFFIALFVLLIIESKRYVGIVAAGLVLGICSQIRLSNGFYLLFGLLYLYLSPTGLRQNLRRIGVFLLSFFIAYGLIFALNRYLDIPFGYSDEITFSLKEFRIPLFLMNLTSLLFSFNYGLFFFSPILLLGLWVYRYIFLKRKGDDWRFIISATPTLVAFPLFASFWWAWAGGLSLNARLITEAVPVLVAFLAFGLARYQRNIVYITLFIVMLLISVFNNILTTYFMDYAWYSHTRGGHLSQNYNAWFHKPTLLESLIKNDTLTIVKFYRKANAIMTKTTVYRPSFNYRSLVTLFEGESEVVNLLKK